MKLFYRKYGMGPPLVILHGLYGSSDNWVTIARKISGSFTVYLPDQRNHGLSPHSSDHSYDALSKDLFELIQDLGIGKFILAGHSMGGKVAVNFALNWPERINALIIIDISPFRHNEYEKQLYLQHQEILKAILSIKPSEYQTRADLEKLMTTKINDEKIRRLILKNLQRTDKGSFEWKLNALSLLENLDRIMEVIPIPGNLPLPVTGFPVTFIKGEDSKYLQMSDLKEIQRIFPASEIVSVRNAGHWIHAEKPDVIEDILLSQLI
jgi:pimeloyl-ACP methyl ester carboxylesterase